MRAQSRAVRWSRYFVALFLAATAVAMLAAGADAQDGLREASERSSNSERATEQIGPEETADREPAVRKDSAWKRLRSSLWPFRPRWHATARDRAPRDAPASSQPMADPAVSPAAFLQQPGPGARVRRPPKPRARPGRTRAHRVRALDLDRPRACPNLYRPKRSRLR